MRFSFIIFFKIFILNLRKRFVLELNKILHTMVTFDELVLAEKRLLIRKLLVKIAEYNASLDNLIFKELSAKIYLNLENLIGGLVQKISNEHNSTKIFDISLSYLLEKCQLKN